MFGILNLMYFFGVGLFDKVLVKIIFFFLVLVMIIWILWLGFIFFFIFLFLCIWYVLVLVIVGVDFVFCWIDFLVGCWNFRDIIFFGRLVCIFNGMCLFILVLVVDLFFVLFCFFCGEWCVVGMLVLGCILWVICLLDFVFLEWFLEVVVVFWSLEINFLFLRSFISLVWIFFFEFLR